MKKRNLINNPTKKNLIIFTIIWALGIILLILSMSNLLTENIFKGKYVMIYFLIIASTLPVFKMYNNYFKNKKSHN